MRYTTGTSCKSGEKLLTWSVQGPAGPKGATGPAGGGGFYFASAIAKETTRGAVMRGPNFALPKGDYLADATIIISVPTGSTSIGCGLSDASGTPEVWNAQTFAGAATLTGRLPITVNAGLQPLVYCHLDDDAQRGLATVRFDVTLFPGPRLPNLTQP